MAGTTFTWTTTGSSVWTLGTNWSPVGPPTAGDLAIVAVGTDLINSGSVSITSLAIGGSLAAPASSKGTLAVTGGAKFVASDAILLWSGSTLSVDGSSSVYVGPLGPAAPGNVVVASGHKLSGDGLVQASIINSGTIEALQNPATASPFPGTLEITGAVSGAGVISLLPGSILKLDSSVSSTQAIKFGSGGAEILVLNAPPAVFSNALTNLNLGDRIEFGGVTQITSAQVTSPGTITVQTNLGNLQLTNVSFAAGASQNLYSYRDGLTGYYAIQVGAQNLTWTGTAGDGLISNAVNWSPALAPNAAEAINFNSNAGGTLVGTASALVANFGGTGTWTLHNANLSLTGQPSPPYHPSAFSEGGRLIVDGGTISATGQGDIDFEPGRHHGGAGRRTGQFPDHLAWQSTWPGRLPVGHRGRDDVEEFAQHEFTRLRWGLVGRRSRRSAERPQRRRRPCDHYQQRECH